MQLDFLLFDTSHEDSGSCSFDAMASVLPARVPALVREVEAVLGWACREFGPPSDAAEEGEWGFVLQAADEHDAPLDVGYDAELARLRMPQPGGRITLALTVTGSPAFAQAFRAAFPDAD